MIIGKMDVTEAIDCAIAKLGKKIDGFTFVEASWGNMDVSAYIYTNNPKLLLGATRITVVFHDKNGNNTRFGMKDG
ncbi:hypothetical protein [Nitrosomonas marina]|uniref:Uncharacterized protein n=1 Tax=Nitrosomonas marina TaxID=917 RepID=A0A1H8HH08_9PROT|nr:hypothetical protein [Nitrosomonas marina]SEN55207.1 hypothetical protein SAMN05216325_12349 [Nitrosomonas marina]